MVLGRTVSRRKSTLLGWIVRKQANLVPLPPSVATTSAASKRTPADLPQTGDMRSPAVRHAVRRLWRDRPVTLVALTVLALGIGANTALFTVVNAVLLKPLPYPAADRLVSVRITDATFPGAYSSVPVNAAHIRTWADRCGSCEALAAIDSMTTTLTGVGESELLDGARVTASFFPVLGITPYPGRAFY